MDKHAVGMFVSLGVSVGNDDDDDVPSEDDGTSYINIFIFCTNVAGTCVFVVILFFVSFLSFRTLFYFYFLLF